MGLDLSIERTDEQLIWTSSTVNVLMGEDLVDQRYKLNKKEEKVYTRKLDSIATLLKYWCTGEGRPENGTFVSFDTTCSKKGNIVMPKFV